MYSGEGDSIEKGLAELLKTSLDYSSTTIPCDDVLNSFWWLLWLTDSPARAAAAAAS